MDFQLRPAFLEPFKTATPQFGFNGLGLLTYLRTYSRLKADGSNEAWWETVQRVVEGTYSMQRRWIKSQGLYWNGLKAQNSAQEMYTRIFTMKFLPPGRGLWAMGSPLTEERGLYAALCNCAFVSTGFIQEEFEEPFTFLMDASMLGLGVGFDTKGAGMIEIHRPKQHDTPYVIPDSREGWVRSLELLLGSYFRPHRKAVVFDYSQIRPAGRPITGFGGVAAGPEPLRDLHESIRQILNQGAGSPLNSRTIVDIMNLVGKCVVAGNVRRSSELALGEMSDPTFLNLKNYEVNPERAAFGWTSNNSVFADLGMDYREAAGLTQLNGEPGYLWLENLQRYGRLADPEGDHDMRAMGANPCAEQTLEHMEICNLVETFPAKHEGFHDYARTLKFAYLYAKTVTLGNTPWPKTNAVILRNRRIGLSQSGIAQALHRFGIEAYRNWCETGYATVQYYDKVYSDWFAIPRSIKTTSIKPSGSVSLVAGATPGMHYPESRFYIRRIRLAIQSELVRLLLQAGYTVEPCVGAEETTVVAEIPVAIDDDIRTAPDVSMWEQLALAAFLQRYWSDNMVSCTVTFDPVTEGSHIAHALEFYQYQLKAVSFLPRLKAGAYPQMPYEAISEARYRELVAALRPLSVDTLHAQAEPERFCSNDTCTL
jgi:adenosylcobalamin-dependent ribonucleoside-triphosphate reductase